MPDITIDALPLGGALTGTEPIPIVQSGVTVRTTTAAIANITPTGGGGGTPGGASGQIQFNNAGAFGGMTPPQVSAFVNDPTLYNVQSGTTYTLAQSDNGKIVTLNNASPITLTCPTGLTAGFSCLLIQLGAGQVNIAAGSGTTVHSYTGLSHLAGQYAMGTIVAPTANNFILGGVATAASGGGLTVGSTAVAGGTSGNFFYNTAGVFGEQTPTQVTAALNLATSALKGLVPASGGGTVNFLRSDLTWATPAAGGGITVGTTTITGGTTANQLYNNAGVVGERNAAQATAFLNPATSALQGVVPASGGGTANFLRADLTWAAPAGGAGAPGGSNTQLQYNNSAAFGGAAITYDSTNSALSLPNSSSTSIFTLHGAAFASVGLNITPGGNLFLGGDGGGVTLLISDGVGFRRGGSVGDIYWINASGAADATSRLSQVGVGNTSGIIEQRYTTIPQTYRVFNTYTSPTNSESAVLDWTTTINTFTLGTQKGSGGGVARPISIVTGGVAAVNLSTAQAVAFPGIGTTASAANAFIDNAAGNNLLRSTSSLRYKSDVTNVPLERANALIALQPIEYRSLGICDDPKIRYVGYAAEQVADIDPAFVNFDSEGRPDSVMYDRILLLKIAALEKRIKELEYKA
jgi:hypothetical protein